MIWYKGNVAVKVRELVKREQEKAFLQNRINFTVTPVCERAKRIICPPVAHEILHRQGYLIWL